MIFALKRKGVRVFLMGVGKGVNKVRTYKFRSCFCNGDRLSKNEVNGAPGRAVELVRKDSAFVRHRIDI